MAASLPCRAPLPRSGRALETIIQDDAQLLHGDDAQVRTALETIRDLGADRVRLTAGWSVLTRDADSGGSAGRSTRPTRPPTSRSAGASSTAPCGIAAELGLRVMIDVAFWAPAWAADDGERPRARARDVDPRAFADFAIAVARRYSGSFEPAGAARRRLLAAAARRASCSTSCSAREAPQTRPVPAPPPGPLPRVDIFTLWNEPNHPGFLKPQWRRDARRGRGREPARLPRDGRAPPTRR